MPQCADTVLMVEPAGFIANPETLADNSLQHASDREDATLLQREALKEFCALRATLEAAGVRVLIYKDRPEFKTPDSIFPNNWFSTHADGSLVLYPMKCQNRRRERRDDIISDLRSRYPKLVDLRRFEEQGRFLESTGSLVLDRANRIVYACLSERTHEELLQHWSDLMGYKPVSFHAFDLNGQAVYHTNCMLGLGHSFAVVCLEAIEEGRERSSVENSLSAGGHEIVEVSLKQMHAFCPNLLELKGADRAPFVILSNGALKAFDRAQLGRIREHATLIHSDLHAIETYGGGGARCMLAEIF